MDHAPSQALPHLFHIDAEHIGIRIVIPLVLVGAFILLFIAFSSAFTTSVEGGSLNCFAMILAAFAAVGVATVADRLLKRVWRSGRAVTLDVDELRFSDKRKGAGGDLRIALHRRVNLLAWRFTVKRGSARVPRNWIMLGCQIAQDDTQLTLFTFAPSKEADAPRYANFVQLILRSVLEKGDVPLREATKQRRLLRAEDERWMLGYELHSEDFATLLDTLAQHDPSWQETP